MTNFFSNIFHSIFSNTKLGVLWLVVRLYLGYEWIIAGYEKVINPVWVGPKAGIAITGFVNGALTKTAGEHPDVAMWYAWFLKHLVLPYASYWSHAVAYGEVLVGAGLMLGALTFVAAFFGFFMNLNYLLAGTVSSNPTMLVLALLIMLANRVAGYIGVDYYLLKTGRS